MNVTEHRSSERNFYKTFSIIIPIIFLLVCSYVALIIDNPTQDSDLLFYFFAGKQILSGDGQNVQIFNAPIGWPIVLASINYFTDDPQTTAKIISLTFSSGIVFVSYYILNNVFDKRTALLGQILISIHPFLHLDTIITHTEILPTFLIFLAIYFITKKQIESKDVILCGIFLGLSFMLRPQSLFVGI